MHHIFFIHPLAEEHLKNIKVLIIMNNAAMNIVEQISRTQETGIQKNPK